MYRFVAHVKDKSNLESDRFDAHLKKTYIATLSVEREWKMLDNDKFNELNRAWQLYRDKRKRVPETKHQKRC